MVSITLNQDLVASLPELVEYNHTVKPKLKCKGVVVIVKS